MFISATSFLPTHGGPAFSVSRLATELANAGLQVGVWAADGTAKATRLLQSPSILRLDGPVRAALGQFGRPDIVHDNGIWLPHNHELARVASRHKIPRLVSLRGMVEPWAMNYKKWKKKVAWQIYQRTDLRLASCLHVTSDMEAESAAGYGLGVPIFKVPNGVDVPEMPTQSHVIEFEQGFRQPRTALFLSRLHPIKGLSLLIEAWGRTRPPLWRLEIAGPDDGGYRAKMEGLVKLRSLGGVVTFVGPLYGKTKTAAYLHSDLFILPSYSENYGMVIAEALAHGLPVVTTTGTPWAELRSQDCGWCVSPTIDEISEALRTATSHKPEVLKAMGERGREWVKREFNWIGIAEEFVEIYSKLRVDHVRPRTALSG